MAQEEDDSSPTVPFRFPPKCVLFSTLADTSKPIAARMRSIFYLRSLGGEDSERALCSSLRDRAGSTLFRHEIAYVLGQMRAKSALEDLSAVLSDVNDDAIVRHEAAEALGAIADVNSLSLLDDLSNDARPEVAETCQVAARRIRWVLEKEAKDKERKNKEEGGVTGDEIDPNDDERVDENPFESIDPAPAKRKPQNTEVPAIQKVLVDQSVPLFERYKAMFSLRNCGSRGAVLALCTGLKDPSPLFRHEVAYVLGQLSHAVATEALMARVADDGEHEMVRHEAAEALGAIGTPTATEFLERYANAGLGDDKAIELKTQMLRESVAVAMDAADYFSSEGVEGVVASSS